MNSIRFPLIATSVLLAACAFHTPQKLVTSPTGYVEAGGATPHEVWKVKRALSKAGIPAYADGKDYPLPYRILVPPEKKEDAAKVIRSLTMIRTE